MRRRTITSCQLCSQKTILAVRLLISQQGIALVTEIDRAQKLLDEINKFVPAEIICNDVFLCQRRWILNDLKNRMGICIHALDSWHFDQDTCEQGTERSFSGGNLRGNWTEGL